MKHPFFFSMFAFVVFTAMLLSDPNDEFPKKGASGACTLELRGEVVVTVASTPEAHAQGLSLHAPLAPSVGMLFRFATTGERSFWMKDMLFPIDIIWLDENLQVLSFYEDVRPESFPTAYTSPSTMRYALEVPAGTVATRGILSGDVATLDSNCAN